MADITITLHDRQVLDMLSDQHVARTRAFEDAAEGARWEVEYDMADHALSTALRLEHADHTYNLLRDAYFGVWSHA